MNAINILRTTAAAFQTTIHINVAAVTICQPPCRVLRSLTIHI
jgi:hypothetical protein